MEPYAEKKSLKRDFTIYDISRSCSLANAIPQFATKEKLYRYLYKKCASYATKARFTATKSTVSSLSVHSQYPWLKTIFKAISQSYIEKVSRFKKGKKRKWLRKQFSNGILTVAVYIGLQKYKKWKVNMITEVFTHLLPCRYKL